MYLQVAVLAVVMVLLEALAEPLVLVLDLLAVQVAAAMVANKVVVAEQADIPLLAELAALAAALLVLHQLAAAAAAAMVQVWAAAALDYMDWAVTAQVVVVVDLAVVQVAHKLVELVVKVAHMVAVQEPQLLVVVRWRAVEQEHWRMLIMYQLLRALAIP